MKRTLIASVMAACLTGVALAQSSGPQGQAPQAQPPQGQPTATPPAVVTGGLSEEALVNAIKALDPNFKVYDTADKQGKVYVFTVVRDGWSYVTRVTVFPNQIWLESSLGSEMPNPPSTPSNVLARLLALNFSIGPSHFAFIPSKDGSKVTLYLCRMLDRRLSVEEFNQYLNGFFKTIRDTHPTWSTVVSAA